MTLAAAALTASDTRGLLDRIAATQSRLPRAERAVAAQLLADPEGCAHCSITELAVRAGTSEATVTRFCRSMQLRGYPHLRLSLAAEAARHGGDEQLSGLTPDISRHDSPADVIAKIAAADIRAVRDTAQRLDPAVLAAVARRLSLARRVEVFGVGSSALVASVVEQRLLHIGVTANATVDVHLALVRASRTDERDVVVLISRSGRTREAVEVAVQARRRDATVVAVTSDPSSPLAEHAHHVLVAVGTETTLRAGTLSSRVPELVIVDCVWVAVALGRYDETVRSLGLAVDSVRDHVLQHADDVGSAQP